MQFMAEQRQGKEKIGCTFRMIFQIFYWGGWDDAEAGKFKGYYRLEDLKKHPSNSFILLMHNLRSKEVK